MQQCQLKDPDRQPDVVAFFTAGIIDWFARM